MTPSRPRFDAAASASSLFDPIDTNLPLEQALPESLFDFEDMLDEEPLLDDESFLDDDPLSDAATFLPFRSGVPVRG